MRAEYSRYYFPLFFKGLGFINPKRSLAFRITRSRAQCALLLFSLARARSHFHKLSRTRTLTHGSLDMFSCRLTILKLVLEVSVLVIICGQIGVVKFEQSPVPGLFEPAAHRGLADPQLLGNVRLLHAL